MGTFFAVEGFPWGVSMVVADAEELGTEPLSTLDQLEAKKPRHGEDRGDRDR